MCAPLPATEKYRAASFMILRMVWASSRNIRSSLRAALLCDCSHLVAEYWTVWVERFGSEQFRPVELDFACAMLCRGPGGSCHERAGHRASLHAPKLFKLFERFRGFSLLSNLFVWTANGRKLTPVASILLSVRCKHPCKKVSLHRLLANLALQFGDFTSDQRLLRF